MADQLFDGRKFRLLTLVDDFTRESLAIEVGQRLTGDRVAEVLDRVGRQRGALPEKIRVDNESEFTSKRLDQWAYLNNVRLDFSRPGKPTDNGLIEAFNGRLRAECLNENWFLSDPPRGRKVYTTFKPPGSAVVQRSRLPRIATLTRQLDRLKENRLSPSQQHYDTNTVHDG